MKPPLLTLLVLLAAYLPACTQSSRAKTHIYGQVETDEIDVSSRIPSRIKKIAVSPGQKVKAGDLLIEFEDDVIAAKRKQAEAAIAAAQSRQGIAENAVRPEEKAQIKAGVIAARKQMEFAKSSLERAKLAFKEGAISQQNLDEVDFKYKASVENYNAMAAKEKMANIGARAEDKAGATALVDQAKGALAEAEAYSKDMNLLSPIDGEVFQILNHEGELVPAGYPVVTLLKLPEVWVTFNIPETELKAFPMGKAVSVTVPALSDLKIIGEISYISPMAGFATKTSTQDRGTFDLKTFELRVKLSAPESVLRPGMTALVGLSD